MPIANCSPGASRCLRDAPGLYASKSGWLLLSVPNALARGAFDALNEPGVELPPDFNAHISVIRPEELAEKGLTQDSITERGHDFRYTLGPVRTVSPHGWDEISKVWYIEVNSPDLEKVRKSYGLSPLPNSNQFKFHITFATRKKNVILDRPYASKSVMHSFPNKKAAGEGSVSLLEAVKAESDRRNYHQKHHVLRELIGRAPDDWRLSEPGGPHPGVTHGPTGVRFRSLYEW